MWETEPAPAAFTAFGLPNQAERRTDYAVHIPWAMGLIGTRSLTTEIPGINDLVKQAEGRIRNGMQAYDALEEIRSHGHGEIPSELRARFDAHSQDLGHTLLLKAYVDDPRQADRRSRLPRPPGTPCRRWLRCSGPSASWSDWARTSSC